MKRYHTQHGKAWAWFVYKGEIPVNAKPNLYVLHHKDPTLKYTDPDRYNEWRVEDLEVMTRHEHQSFHAKREFSNPTSKLGSDKWKAKISASLKGHVLSEETREKIGAAQRGTSKPNVSASLKEYFKTHDAHNKGISPSAESKEKNRLARLGKKWYNNGKVAKFFYPDQVPAGFILGRLK